MMSEDLNAKKSPGIFYPESNHRPASKKSFAAIFLVHTLLKSNGFLEILESLPLETKQRDSLIALLFYAVIEPFSSVSAQAWLQTSLLSLIYPLADLSETNLEKLYRMLENEEIQMDFFQKYNAWIKEHYPKDQTILMGEDILPFGSLDPLGFFSLLNGNPFGLDPFACFFAFQKKSGLPLCYRLDSGSWQMDQDVIAALKQCKELGLDLDYCLLKQEDTEIDLAEIFYHNGKCDLDYLIWLDLHDIDLEEYFDFDPDQDEKSDNQIAWRQYHYAPCTCKIDVDQENHSDPAWLTYFRPLPHYNVFDEETEDEYDEDELFLMDEIFSMPLFLLLSAKKRTPRALLSRLHPPKAENILEFLSKKLTYLNISNSNRNGAFFAIFLSCILNRILEMAFYKNRLRTGRLTVLNFASGTLYKTKFKPKEPTEFDLECFSAFDLAWPKEIPVKNGRPDLSSFTIAKEKLFPEIKSKETKQSKKAQSQTKQQDCNPSQKAEPKTEAKTK